MASEYPRGHVTEPLRHFVVTCRKSDSGDVATKYTGLRFLYKATVYCPGSMPIDICVHFVNCRKKKALARGRGCCMVKLFCTFWIDAVPVLMRGVCVCASNLSLCFRLSSTVSRKCEFSAI